MAIASCFYLFVKPAQPRFLAWLACCLLMTPSPESLAEDPPADASAAVNDPNTATDTTPNAAKAADGANTSTEASPPPELPRITPDPAAHQRTAALKQVQYNGAIQTVELVSDEQHFNAVFLQERTGNPQGAALILHDQGQHLLWPALVAPLQQSLPDYGWATLTIELPPLPQAVVPPASVYTVKVAADPEAPPAPDSSDEADNQATSAAPDPAAESAPTETAETREPPTPPDNRATDPVLGEPPLPERTDTPTPPSAESEDGSVTPDTATTSPLPEPDYQQQLQDWNHEVGQRLASAIRYLNSRGQLNLAIISTGTSSPAAVNYLLANLKRNDRGEAERGMALVMMQARELPALMPALIETLPGLAIPILDLVSKDTGISDPVDVRERAGAMRHQQHKEYRLYRMTTIAGELDNRQTLRQIRGWLKTRAAGTELGRR